MEFDLHTYDLQDIVIALICNDSSVLKDHPDRIERLKTLFAEANWMCNRDNDFTVHVTITGKEN